LQGQEYSYVPYVKGGSIWNYCTIDESASDSMYWWYNYERYTITEDTVCIGDNCYNKMFYGCPQNQSYYGAFREQDKKIYFVESGGSTEKVVYDFSLNIGDTFVCHVDTFLIHDTPYIASHIIIVSNIDTIDIGGSLRKRFGFGLGIDNAWIEGIGNMQFLIDPYAYIPEYQYKLNYKKENDKIVYLSTESWFNENDCDDVGIENTAMHDGTNTLFQNTPNPFNISTTIKYQLSDNATNAKICIYNLTGKQLQCYNLPATKGESSIEVCASSLQSGMYLYSLIVGDKLISTKRMVLTE
jgi:hypothetical protein